jgi:hypothetical protein
MPNQVYPKEKKRGHHAKGSANKQHQAQQRTAAKNLFDAFRRAATVEAGPNHMTFCRFLGEAIEQKLMTKTMVRGLLGQHAFKRVATHAPDTKASTENREKLLRVFAALHDFKYYPGQPKRRAIAANQGEYTEPLAPAA